MITAVDTSTLMDIFLDDPKHGRSSGKTLDQALLDGAVTASPIVWAELRPLFDSDEELISILAKLEVRYDDLGREAALLAGKMWQDYRKGGGKRERVLADFLIGAHAVTKADRLLARDRGYFRKYFRRLKLMG